MLRRFIGLSLMLCCLACVRLKVSQEPAAGSFYNSLSIKFNFMDRQGKQNGRIHWRFDDRQGKFLFFTPLNQVAMELDSVGEVALLINFDKKIFWRGDFSFLLNRLWSIDLTLQELKQLLIQGLVPQEKIKGKGIAVSLETNPKDQLPQIVNIKQNDASLTLKILKNETRPGNIVLLDYGRRFQPAELENVLGND